MLKFSHVLTPPSSSVELNWSLFTAHSRAFPLALLQTAGRHTCGSPAARPRVPIQAGCGPARRSDWLSPGADKRRVGRGAESAAHSGATLQVSVTPVSRATLVSAFTGSPNCFFVLSEVVYELHTTKLHGSGLKCEELKHFFRYLPHTDRLLPVNVQSKTSLPLKFNMIQ